MHSAHRLDLSGVVGRAEIGDELRLGAVRGAIEHVHVEPPLHAEKRREQADRTGTGDQDACRLPVSALADTFDVFPRLGHDASRLQQHAALGKLRIHPDREPLVDAVTLGGEAVQALDAVLCEAAVLAHVPLALSAARARQRIRLANDAADPLSGRKAAVRRRFENAAERLMAEDEPFLAGRRRAVLSAEDLAIGSADAEDLRLDQNVPRSKRRFRHVIQTGRVGDTGDHGQGKHGRSVSRSSARPPA